MTAEEFIQCDKMRQAYFDKCADFCEEVARFLEHLTHKYHTHEEQTRSHTHLR